MGRCDGLISCPKRFDNKDQEEQGSQGIPVFPSWLLKPLCSQAQELELEFEESKSARIPSHDRPLTKITCASVDRYRLD